MKILFVEPFYSGSHKQFADQLKKHSNHHITLLTLEGKFWKWRMYGAAMTLAEKFLDMTFVPDLILVTDMLDLPVFLSCIRHKLPSNIPVVNYFHENQLAYPWKDGSEDKSTKRDLHYAMMNYQSAYASDFVLFNSAYNMNSLYDGLETLLDKMPDHKHTNLLKQLKAKSRVLPLGLELSPIVNHQKKDPAKPPLILWNHRWEHDKNPELFFKGLRALKDKKVPFQLALLGENYKSMPECFTLAKEEFQEELVHYGHADDDTYIYYLNAADLLPVTSVHEFFGISVMEAIHCGARPILPKRLSYVELYHPAEHPELFYELDSDFPELLVRITSSLNANNNYQHLTKKYDWSTMSAVYDEFFQWTQAEHTKMI